jgi:hypothetical protein
MNTVASSRNPWPIAIITYFIIFSTGIAIFITWAVRQRMDLVRPDYYEEEMRFEQQMHRVQRTHLLAGALGLAYHSADNSLRIELPAAHRGNPVTGRLQLYRPSDARQDQQFPLAINATGSARLDAVHLATGLWKARVYWSVGAEEFFHEQSLVVD